MRQVNCDFIRDKRYSSWSKEVPLWWCLYRTEQAGSFNEHDMHVFNACSGRYVIFFDHSQYHQAKEFALYLIDRYNHFFAAKVSKFARDGEKILVLLAHDSSLYESLKIFASQWGMHLHCFMDKETFLDHEKRSRGMTADYLIKLARAFIPEK